MTLNLQWLESETITAEEGGDTAITLVGELEIDAIINETWDSSVVVTDHPVEEGVDISDHIRPNLDMVTLELAVSNQPIRPLTELDGVSSVDLPLPRRSQIVRGASGNQRSQIEEFAQQASASVLQFTGEFDRPREVYDQLQLLMDSGTLVDFVGVRFGDLEGWVIADLSVPVTITDGIQFTMTIREFRTATTEEVEAPSPRVERGRNTRDRGDQTGNEEGGDQPRASAAFTGYNAIADRLNLPQLQSRQ